jgi:hypothetical protein
MGNNSSSIPTGTENKKATTDWFFAPSANVIDAGTEVEQITATISDVLRFHTALHDVFDKLVPILPTFEHKLSVAGPVSKILNASLNPKNPEDSNLVYVQFLFNLGVLKTVLKTNETMSVHVHNNFKPIHSKFLENLQKLSSIVPIKSEFSLDTVSDQTIKEQFDNNLKTMNNIMARIIFYKYCIVFNNYLNHIYAIYAHTQMDLFESQIKKQKKQNEFVIVQKALQDALDGTNTKYNTKLSHSLNALNKKISNTTSGGANAKSNTPPQNTRIVSNIKNVQTLLQKSFKEFELSNLQTAEFFNKINNIIEAKTTTIISKYQDMNMSQLLNKNIIKVLGDLEKKIHDNTITPTSDNIEMILSNLTNGEQEKELLRGYLQMVSIQANAQHLNETLNTSHIAQPVITTSQPQVKPQSQVNTPQSQVRPQVKPQVNTPQPQVRPQVAATPQPQVASPQSNNASKKI